MPGTSKDYDTAVDDHQNPKQFIKKDPKDGINILGHFELTLKEDYLKKRSIKPIVNQSYTYRSTYNYHSSILRKGVCAVPDCKCSSIPRKGYCNQCWKLIQVYSPRYLGSTANMVSDKTSDWYKKRFGNTPTYRKLLTPVTFVNT